jgi:hypothetical protein
MDLFESTTVLVSSCLSAWSGCVHLLFCSSVRSRSIPTAKSQVASHKNLQQACAKLTRTRTYELIHIHCTSRRAGQICCPITRSAILLSAHPRGICKAQRNMCAVRTNPKKIQFEDSCNKCSLFVGRGPTSPHHTATAAAALKTSRPKHLGYGLDTGRFRLSV